MKSVMWLGLDPMSEVRLAQLELAHGLDSSRWDPDSTCPDHGMKISDGP